MSIICVTCNNKWYQTITDLSNRVDVVYDFMKSKLERDDFILARDGRFVSKNEILQNVHNRLDHGFIALTERNYDDAEKKYTH